MKFNFTVVGSYFTQVMSDGGTPSSSRWLTLVHSLVACGCLIFVTIKNHAMPDGMTLTGLGAFVSAPYAVNRASAIFGAKADSAPPVVPKV